MSLNKGSSVTIIGRLFRYKCKAYVEMLSSLLLLQLFAVLLSVTIMTSSTSTSFQDGLHLTMENYSADMVIVFTMIWGMFSAINLTTRAYREDDFLFVTNRFTSHVSTILFLAAISTVGGITAAFSSFLVRVLAYYLNDPTVLIGTNMEVGAVLFIIGTASTVFYVLMFTAAGYLAGIIIQWHQLFKLLLPAIILGGLMLQGENNTAAWLHDFFYLESSFPIFAGKMLGALLLLFGAALLLANRLEVKQG
ncbi:hypothetical protein [Salibacterium aidingense]|uniref:hypothetical protein n=1 Tax=Salibacterium aidingense TaxID=384933 RepID=UPI00047CFABA|nr:hypothetical protein [Salibacterium aidingense]